MREIWRLSSLLAGKYEVSSHGRLRRATAARGTAIGKIIKTAVLADGYERVVLHLKVGRRKYACKNYLVHKLVMHAFVGPRPKGMEIDHENRNRSDNFLGNLSYKTRAENAARGNSRSGKTSPAVVRKIRRSPLGHSAVARLYGITPQTVWSIRQREIWRHI